jgi:hypothetical protein
MEGQKNDEPLTTDQFSDHFISDDVIPHRITKKTTFLSSWLLLVSACIGYIYSFYVVASLLVIVWLTSIIHWWSPHFSTIIRRCDFLAVFATLIYGTYFTVRYVSQPYVLAWIISLSIIAVVFVGNESLYFIRTSRAQSGAEADYGPWGFGEWATAAGTQAREDALWLTAVTHSLCVHVFANALCIIILIAANDEHVKSEAA